MKKWKLKKMSSVRLQKLQVKLDDTKKHRKTLKRIKKIMEKRGVK